MKKNILIFCLSMLGTSFNAYGQGVFDTGETKLSYNYVQAQYLFNQDPIKFPVVFSAWVNVYNNFSISAEYLSLGADIDVDVVGGGVDTVSTKIITRSLGLNYHRSSERWRKVDWLVGLRYESYEIKAASSTTSILIESDSMDVDLGLRVSLFPKAEVQVVVTFPYSNDEFGDERTDVTGVYRVIDHFALAFGAVNATSGDPNYNMGLRYSW